MRWRSVAAGLVAASWPIYARRIRPRVLTWGSTVSEATTRFPGDELLEQADGVATRAIEINAPASAVWPWIAQIGPAPRGGAYTYDWIENLLGLNMHSVDRVLPEFQRPQLGDVIGYGANRMRIERLEPERVLAWRSEDGNWVWCFVLVERDRITRLISRNRFRLPTLVARLGMLPMEPASLLMERKMLRGIKRRAERLAASTAADAPREAGEQLRVLVTYATRYGSTRKVAESIAATLRSRGHKVELRAAEQAGDVAPFDAVVLGSPVFNQRWLPEANEFVNRNLNTLANRRVWLFSVGTFGDGKRLIGGLMKREPKGIRALERTINPREYRVFAGVIDRRQWPFLSRLFFHLLGGHLGDNRNWSAIERWADEITRDLANDEER
jgi:menaquinone-dependent protoporphyrinogen IX oxidase